MLGFLTGGSGASRTARREAEKVRNYATQLQQDTQFQPIGLTTSYGGFDFDPDTGYSATMSPEQSAMMDRLYSGAGGMFDRATADPAQRAAELTNQRIALLQPQLQQQQADLQANLFGSGRLGLQLAGSGAGAGSGMVNPDMFGYQQGVNQLFAQIAADAQGEALNEAQTYATLGRGMFADANQISDRELALLELGINAEATRQAGNIASGQLGLGGFQSASQMQTNAANAAAQRRAGLFSGILSGAATLGAAKLGN